MIDDNVDLIIQSFMLKRHEFEIFMDGTADLFRKHPSISTGPFPIVHSIKKRIKDYDHLRDKIRRKYTDGVEITQQSCFKTITDFAGVRVLHLKQDDFAGPIQQ